MAIEPGRALVLALLSAIVGGCAELPFLPAPIPPPVTTPVQPPQGLLVTSVSAPSR